jgi:ABC-type Na+ transport system ATPase subunit NatA
VIYQGRVVEHGTLADVRAKHKNQNLEDIFVRLTEQEGI